MIEALKYVYTLFAAAVPPIAQTMRPDGKGTLIALRQGYTIESKDGPKEARPAHTFRDANDFAAYLLREAGEKRADPAKAIVLLREEGIAATLDGYDLTASRVTCSLEAAPGWAAWQRVIGVPMDIDQLYMHVRSYGYTVAPELVKLDGKEQEKDGAALLLAALSNFSIQSESFAKVERGPRGEIIAKESGDKNSVSASIPSSFGLSLPLFLADAEPVGIEIQVNLRINKDKQAVFTLTAPRAAEAQQKALANLAAKLGASLPGWLVALGKPEMREVLGTPVRL